jgi:uncharacterized tellurite resistance protein B-like protein
MIGRRLSLLQQLSNTIKESLSNDDKLIILEELATLIAIGIWTDKKVREEELIEGETIIEKILENHSDIEFTEDKVTSQLKKFQEDNKYFCQKKSELIVNIIINAKYDYAEYIIDIFKADGEIAPEEKEFVDELSTYLNIKDSLLFKAKIGAFC